MVFLGNCGSTRAPNSQEEKAMPNPVKVILPVKFDFVFEKKLTDFLKNFLKS
jgi:hypothetical protein